MQVLACVQRRLIDERTLDFTQGKNCLTQDFDLLNIIFHHVISCPINFTESNLSDTDRCIMHLLTLNFILYSVLLAAQTDLSVSHKKYKIIRIKQL